MNPVFYQYKIEHNILDELIGEFQKRSWLFDEMPPGYFHKFKWPDIVLSDKEATLNLPDDMSKNDNEKHIIELLGAYQAGENSENEGQVILYMPRIRETAFVYAKFKTGKIEAELCEDERKYYIELLTKLVLIHEFTHWIVHVGKFGVFKEEFSKPIKIKYDDKDSIFFHESIAQIFTNYFCQRDSQLDDLFYWLEQQQPIQYQIYKDLIFGDGIAQISEKGDTVYPVDKSFHQEVNSESINRIIFALMVLRVSDKQQQSYNELKAIVSQIKGSDVEEYFKYERIEVFRTWDWGKTSFSEFVKDRRGSFPAKKFKI